MSETKYYLILSTSHWI